MIEYLFMASAVISLIALVRGPTFADRALASGVFVNIAVMLLLIYITRAGNWVYLDISIVIVFMSFVGTLAIARYARRKR